MLLVIAALLAAPPPRGQEAAQAQAQPASIRSLTAIRVVPVGADDEGGSGANPDPTPVVAEHPGSSWYSLYDGRHVGLLVDGGAPIGAGVAGLFRPWRFLRLEGGVNWNYLSFGLRGGLTVIPFEFGVTPTIHLEAGHFFNGDASRFTSNAGAKILLAHIPDDYLSALLGLEFGSQQRFVFFLRAGLSWIRSEAQNVKQGINAINPPGSTTTVKSAANAPLLLQAPTVSAGVVFFLF
jgi:hypothetical protein